jgi:hypothetical protein
MDRSQDRPGSFVGPNVAVRILAVGAAKEAGHINIILKSVFRVIFDQKVRRIVIFAGVFAGWAHILQRVGAVQNVIVALACLALTR